MTVGTQGSLFEADVREPELGTLGAAVQRRTLTAGAWVDLRPGWLSGAGLLLDHLIDGVDWVSERRQMYDRMVDVPRLVRFYDETERLPHAVLDIARTALTRHYRRELPEGFATAGLAYYRDGSDSVAWHGDRIGRGNSHDTMVAIVALGGPRPFLMRPRGGGESIRFSIAHGDLIVMGGSAQRTWEHAVPKVAAAGPRISVQFRPPGVR
ncbi:alpha-ketoglutarate-dependent dioxygenase AlkB [Gordonia jinhuaensis]|uniref:Alkylated DNA repair protein n=1 Tax=Gordonia jinhuaensis TaxID=1517702 RepID=A0A916TIT6_9ACTN|nr:alpha-ketoglutarate-dependent dioxygenase AlkB [Gordonia jinhuaensis]GGB47138.1 alkylated DNA repair protein [Gordonia jinhuaensis]